MMMKKKPVKLKSRANAEQPEIFIRSMDEGEPRYSRASIRIKPGNYCYLVWREGEHVRNFYLGKRRES